ncbi:helix-turn-helix domain-containing protein [Clostridium perfringens]|nr:helix-turn-helix domain-containing protein [Clostridium perfringens]EGT0015033.1 helix-turn-helix domain-containing protein [Clostridium perfringens]
MPTKDDKHESNIIKISGILSQGYGLAPKLVMRDTRLSIESKAIYCYFCSFAGNGESAFPSVKLQLHDLGISKTRYYKHRKLLEDYGYVTIRSTRIKNENNKSIRDKNIYILEQFPVVKTNKPSSESSPDLNHFSECPQNKELNQDIENTNISECPCFDEVQNDDTQNEDSNSNNFINNKSINNNRKISKENYLTNISSSVPKIKKVILPDTDAIDKYIVALLKKDKAFVGINFDEGEYYMAFIESVTVTQIQDNVEVLSIDQWKYFRQTLINKISVLK